MSEITVYEVRLHLESMAGGAPSNIDAYLTYLQNPMMARAVPPEARQEFTEQLADLGVPISADGKPLDPVVKTGFHLNEDGQPLIMNFQVKAMLQGAARTLYTVGSKPNIYSVAGAITYALEVAPEEIPILGGEILKKPWRISQIISHPRNPDIKVPSQRERQILVDGRVTFKLILMAGGRGKVLTDILEDLLQTGGMFTGLGTDRGYGHGRFAVEAFALQGVTKIGPEMLARVNNPNRRGIGYVRKQRQAAEPET